MQNQLNGNISGGGLVSMSAAAAVAIAENLDVETLAILSAFLSSLSSNLALIAQNRSHERVLPATFR